MRLAFWHSTMAQKVSCPLMGSSQFPSGVRAETSSPLPAFSAAPAAALPCLATERQYGLGGASDRGVLFGILGSLALHSIEIHIGTEETLRGYLSRKSPGWWGSPGTGIPTGGDARKAT